MEGFMKIMWGVIVGSSLVGQPSYMYGLGNLTTSMAWGTWLHHGLGKLATSKAVWHRPPAEPSAVRTTGLTITLFQLVYKRATLCISNTRNCPLKRRFHLFYCICALEEAEILLQPVVTCNPTQLWCVFEIILLQVIEETRNVGNKETPL